VIKVSGVQ
jgi:hypothetical protein